MHLDWLYDRMALVADETAIVWPGGVVTYGDLVSEREPWGEALDGVGVAPGQVVALLGDYSPGSCAALLALVDRGAIVVPLTTITASSHEEFLETSQAQGLLTFGADDSWTFEHIGRDITHPLLRRLADHHTPGLVMFSSGSTGKSKGMVHDFGRVLEKFHVRRAPLVTLNFLLFDHMGGLNTLFHTLSNDGTVVVTRSRDPEAICALVQQHRVELLPVSPTFLNLLLLSDAHHRYDLSSLKVITYGTEVMPQATLDRVRAAFPGLRLQQTYGLSETGALRTKSRDDGSLWLMVGGEGVETKVVDGTLWIRSRFAMLGYLNAPSPFDDEGWLDTQDKVEVDGDYVRFLGRVTDIINVGGNKVYPAEVESTLLELDNVQDALVFGETHPLTGQVVVARLVLDRPEPLPELTKRVRTHAAGKLERFKVPVRVEVAEATKVSARMKKARGTAPPPPSPSAPSDPS